MEVCIVYVESWLRGNGCIPVNFKMEDAATAEISRAQASKALRMFSARTAVKSLLEFLSRLDLTTGSYRCVPKYKGSLHFSI